MLKYIGNGENPFVDYFLETSSQMIFYRSYATDHILPLGATLSQWNSDPEVSIELKVKLDDQLSKLEQIGHDISLLSIEP